MKKARLGTYQNLCTQVYNFRRPHAPENEYIFYKSYVSEVAGAILEPMCGSGRFLLPLLKEGFDIHGFDASIYMLQSLLNKAKLDKLTPDVQQEFVENFNQDKLYSLIFIPTGSFGHII